MSSATPSEGNSTAQVSKPDNRSTRQYDAPPPDPSRLVQRPVPQSQVEDPRSFQMSQIKRRFQHSETETLDGTSFTLNVVPSDPDFPFEIDALACVLSVPSLYPVSKPSLRVTNKEMGRGYQINVERGFDEIVQRLPNGTLLQYLNALDKQLEVFLAAPKVETVKILAHNMKKHKEAEASRVVVTSTPKIQTSPVSQPSKPSPPLYTPPTPVFTADELNRAQGKRKADVGQLEARLGRLPQYSKSADGLGYVIPVEPRKRGNLPPSLQAIKTVKLIVPHLYNLEPCRIQLQGVSGQDATHLEEAFRIRVVENANLTLVTHINYFSQNMHMMATKHTETKSPDVVPLSSAEPPQQISKVVQGTTSSGSKFQLQICFQCRLMATISTCIQCRAISIPYWICLVYHLY
jgi:hypothetical protein